MTQDLTTYFVWIGGSCYYGHKERAGGAAVVIEQNGKTISKDVIADKYVEMNVCHPFMEGNGRSTRIWLEMMLKARLGKCVDWSKIEKSAYLQAMTASVADGSRIKQLLRDALTDDISSREMFMKGIVYSYYYEQEDEV